MKAILALAALVAVAAAAAAPTTSSPSVTTESSSSFFCPNKKEAMESTSCAWYADSSCCTTADADAIGKAASAALSSDSEACGNAKPTGACLDDFNLLACASCSPDFGTTLGVPCQSFIDQIASDCDSYLQNCPASLQAVASLTGLPTTDCFNAASVSGASVVVAAVAAVAALFM